jgi:hypothetical protein
MTTISTQQLANRLQQTFRNVKPLERIELPSNLTNSQIVHASSIDGVEFSVGVFTTDKDTENGDYTRFVQILDLFFHF